jgi:hypothetical protein
MPAFVKDNRVSILDNCLYATCCCGATNKYGSKGSALKMLRRGVCRSCMAVSGSVVPEGSSIYQNKDGNWCSNCSRCGIEQVYGRKEHAKQSEIANWKCRKCVGELKSFNNNMPVGSMQRAYNRYQKQAQARGIPWNLDIAYMSAIYFGTCSLTGWPITLDTSGVTASLDRINSAKGYESGNVQWVHSMVNMCKNKYDQTKFIEMCQAIAENADKVKW